LCSEIPEIDKLLAEFEAVAKQLNEVLDDLKWRKPDVEDEERKLAKLMRQAKKDPGVNVASHAVVVRVLRGVLDDKIAEAERLEKRLVELKEQITVLEKEAEREKGKSESGEEAA